MSSYEYSSSSSGGAGFDLAKAIFAQVDKNGDGTIDRNEFNEWAAGGETLSGAGASASAGQYSISGLVAGAGNAGGSFETSSYGSSSFGATGGAGFGIDTSLVAGGAGYDAGASSYQTSSFGASAGGFDTATIGQAANYTADSNAAWSRYGADVRGAGLFVDPNPQIIRRQAAGGAQTYTQNIKVRFLQPPPVPPPGPLIIKEVRPPQPPAPQPLRIKQQAPPLPQPPPLILRERPPQPPAAIASQTVIRRLAAIPVPPRSVVIERLPAAPPRPRDIVIERWVPYGAPAKRQTIVQRAAAAKAYPTPRNIIVQYEPVQVRVVRQFQRLGVTGENPQLYVQRYGGQLLDSTGLLQQARSAGVVEDISPPAGAAASFSASSSSFGVGAVGGGDSGFEFSGVSGGDFGGASSSFSSSSFEASQVDGGAAGGFSSGSAYESGLAGSAGGAYGSSSVESSSFSSGDLGVGGAVDLGASGGYSESSFSSGGGFGGSSFSAGGGSAGFDVIAAAFRNADKNNDGIIDAEEFKQFYQGGL